MTRISRLLLRNGSVIHPGKGVVRRQDVLIENGHITRLGKNLRPRAVETYDCRGKYIAPGFIDMHCHLREPGNEDAETISSGTRAALAGGFTRVCPMPNTLPPVDTEAAVRFQTQKAKRAGFARVFPVGCATRGRQGKDLAEIGSMHSAGAVAFSDDGNWVEDAAVMRRVLEYCKAFDVPVISHCEMARLAEGVANEGLLSTRLGLRGKPWPGEAAAAARDVMLAEFLGARLHVAHVSCAATVDVIRWAKRRKVQVTAEACPHHFSLTDESLAGYDSRFKVNPPLRTETDRKAVLDGLADGTIDCIATDHAPHTKSDKEVEFDRAPAGMTGFETAFSLGYEHLVLAKRMRLPQYVARLTVMPARILGLDEPAIEKGLPSELVLLDVKQEWVFEEENVRSRSSNSPFIGRKMRGRVLGGVLPGGRMWLEPGA